MSYNDDKASEYERAANQSSLGSTEYWDNVVKKGNHQIKSQLEQEAHKGYEHVWSPGSGSAPNTKKLAKLLHMDCKLVYNL